jgi:hypothetical protein
VRPDAAGETTPDRTTVSAAPAVDGLTPSDAAEATAACADVTAASGDTIAKTANNTISDR